MNVWLVVGLAVAGVLLLGDRLLAELRLRRLERDLVDRLDKLSARVRKTIAGEHSIEVEVSMKDDDFREGLQRVEAQLGEFQERVRAIVGRAEDDLARVSRHIDEITKGKP